MNGITFGTKHTYDDWGVLVSDVTITPPSPKTAFVNIEGADGSLDLTEALGEVRYNTRKATIVLKIVPPADIEQMFSTISNYLNGRRTQMVLDKDPDYYYRGRFEVSSASSDYPIGTITITGTLDPWKYHLNETVKTYELTSTPTNRFITIGRRSVAPEFTVSGTASIVFNGNTYSLNAGTHILPDIVFTEGSNTIKVSGTGALVVKFQEGEM